MFSVSSPTGTRDSQVNTTTRQKTNPKLQPFNEDEFYLASNSNPDAPTSIPVVSPSRSVLEAVQLVQVNIQENKEEFVRSWIRFTRKEIGVMASLRALGFSSWMNILLLLIPLAWVSRFLGWHIATFILSFFAIIPLERLFDYGGGQMSYYLGKDLGELLIITLNNSVEATLAIILLTNCKLQLLKATIVGVVVLHLLLVPGASFATGGARIIQQDLHPHATELNHSLLTLGVLSLLLPAAFFAALNTDFSPPGTAVGTFSDISDETRGNLLKMSRGIAILLLIVYICSRVYLHNPPGGKSDELTKQVTAPLVLQQSEDPEVNQWVCLAMLIICIGIMAATAEWLVESIEFVKEVGGIEEEWFGLILLPIVSFAADGFVAVTYFTRYMFRHFFREPVPPSPLAKAEAIDLSIQFILFWMPFFILLAWWTHKPLTLLFDVYEVAVIIGSCFIVNYVTADSKTNWAEGVSMISFYIMIALCAWFYPGQPELQYLSQCESVALALSQSPASLVDSA